MRDSDPYDDKKFHHKSFLCKTYGKICQICKIQFNKGALTVDHIIPKWLGGTSRIENKQLLCIKCHRLKTDFENTLRDKFGMTKI